MHLAWQWIGWFGWLAAGATGVVISFLPTMNPEMKIPATTSTAPATMPTQARIELSRFCGVSVMALDHAVAEPSA